MSGEVTLDQIDRAILQVMACDARISITELGQRVGLSKTPVAARLKRLEQAGVITGYRADLSAQKLGLDHIAFVQVSLSDTRELALRAFNEGIRTVAEVEECHMIAGNFDYLVKVRTGDIKAYRRVLSEQISQLPYVASTSTYVAMETVRERDSFV
ncbi:MAG: Lrp/AsnC family transcriptional regulator [Devosiaceae bacterium]|nr:Lrp/AsnC family transcriptional regulator [Devosiaceae bacterium MH13]